jgi:hypothetical protein
MNSAEGVMQRGVVELGRPATSEVLVGTVEVVPVRALLLGERLDTRALERDKPLGIAPLTVEIAGGGMAVLFRYGAIVLFGMATAAMDSFVASLKPLVAGIFPVPEQDEVRLMVRPAIDEQVDPSGNIILHEKTTERLQLVADILAKSLVLSHYETRIAGKGTRRSERQRAAAPYRRCPFDPAKDGRPGRNRREARALMGASRTRASLHAPGRRIRAA